MMLTVGKDISREMADESDIGTANSITDMAHVGKSVEVHRWDFVAIVV